MSTRIAKSNSPMRKLPRQGRSQATVEAIIEAGAHILGEKGWDDFSTNKVAELAGVSIGSLYQYFPDKQSLVEAIRRRHLDDCLAVMRGSLREGKAVEQFAEDLVRDMFAAHSINPGLHRKLLDEAQSSESMRDPNSAFEAEYLGHYTAAVAAYRTSRSGANERVAGMVLSDLMDGVVHNAARRGLLGSEELKQELIRLVRAYLTVAD
ncbi:MULTISPECIES: TetR/AcrR family transcriptional regulator [Aminobacter]|uniref:AcrR family transcriptional regulator n=3 Tax=Aminobacter TaxID=31988 RepID=A0AAC8YKA7_AMIAI|nr:MULTISPECIES: TetR/AcrR family transcriptional regulator [Aminobacter]AMS39439.1 TetR family transcriptional regulator [Aminobacter aminovorans]MBA8909359.1 AcrR family transcriptional regulator [Aminobacter ciceronei]MBA9023151.1 AcrR family transcriptional regulator [Aminobacter ciceronei]MBB3707585.1 AcrR family transcriptional regulator [Aminobacter aminovorans]WMC97269.1 TetR/AcrR family transcriptional regulator [Aminobacter aminovorans]